MAGKYRDIYYRFNKYFSRFLPDSLYHNILGYIGHHRFGASYHWMNIHHPRTFNEKMQWLKTHGDIPLKTKLADKYDVREFIRERIGEEHLVELLPMNRRGDLFVQNADDIDFDILPEQFVIKMAKGSGYNLICPAKSKLDIEATRKKLADWLRINYFYLSREPQYKGANRLICEKMLKYNITDYKFFCFDGEPRYVTVHLDRFGNYSMHHYDMEWKKPPFITLEYPNDRDLPLPECFEDLKEIARRLSKGFPFVRVDLYEHEGKVYFGEMTFHPTGGYAPINPREWDFRLGDMINLKDQ